MRAPFRCSTDAAVSLAEKAQPRDAGTRGILSFPARINPDDVALTIERSFLLGVFVVLYVAIR
jgi:hypothetical protein